MSEGPKGNSSSRWRQDKFLRLSLLLALLSCVYGMDWGIAEP